MMKATVNEEKKTILLEDDDKEVRYIEYQLENNTMNVTHTFVYPEYRGKGYGKVLTKKAMEFAEEKGYEFSATCSFVANKVKK